VARDIDRVVAKFVPECIWRDLVTFTWNIKTVEGHEGIADMLRARLADTDPSGFRTRETPTDDGGGVASAFIEFETAVGRGVGHLRLKGDLGWTLLTALDELKGHEE
jgi:putative flavoprotein involved in K+ transport